MSMSTTARARLVVAAMSIGLPSPFAIAKPTDMDIFGHRVLIETNRDGSETLTIGGAKVLNDYNMEINALAFVSGTLTVVGRTHAGGNMCAGSVFVISFPSNAKPRIDGPLSDCNSYGWTIRPETIEFEYDPSPLAPGKRWSWTPSGGFPAAEDVPLVVDTALDWDALRERTIQHPSELLRYGPIAGALNTAAGIDIALVKKIISGPATGEFEEQAYIAEVCAPHSCGNEDMLLIADGRRKQVFLAWKLEGQKIVVRPAVGSWPSEFRQELKIWASRWR